MEYFVLETIKSPEVKIYDGELFTATEIAEKLGITAKDLNMYLVRKGVLKRYNIHCLEVIDKDLERRLGRYVLPSRTLTQNPLYKWNKEGIDFILNLIKEDMLKC